MKKLSFLLPLFLLLVFSACKPKQERIAFKHANNTVYVRLQAEPDKLNPLISTSAYGHGRRCAVYLQGPI